MDKKGEFEFNGIFDKLGLLAITLLIFGFILVISFVIQDKGRDILIADEQDEYCDVSTFCAAYTKPLDFKTFNKSSSKCYNASNLSQVEVEGVLKMDTFNATAGLCYNSSSLLGQLGTQAHLTAGYNGTNTVVRETYNTTSWLGIIIITIIGSIIVGLIYMFKR